MLKKINNYHIFILILIVFILNTILFRSIDITKAQFPSPPGTPGEQTTNIVVNPLQEDLDLGSQSINDLSVRKEETNEIKKVVDNEIKKFFKPEFLNRLDEIVIFNNLGLNDIKEIAKIQLQHLEKRLNKKNLKFRITDETINQLVENSFDHVYGARPLKRIIQKQIETKISNNILNNHYLSKDEINIYLVNGEINVD